MIVEWTDDLMVGIGIIDDQHKKLIERIASFVEAVESDNMLTIEETIKYLIGYTIQHFGAEELIMIRNGYLNFKIHRDEHSHFIKMVYDANISLMGKTLTKEQIINLRDELLAWVITHIKVMDKQLSEAINK